MKKEFSTIKLILLVLVTSLLSSICTGAILYFIITSTSILDNDVSVDYLKSIENNNNTPVIKISKDSLTIEISDNYKLDAIIYGATEEVNNIIWYSSDSVVASVDDDGIVSAKSVGKATIIAEYRDKLGKYYLAKCVVNVIENKD